MDEREVDPTKRGSLRDRVEKVGTDTAEGESLRRGLTDHFYRREGDDVAGEAGCGRE